MKLFSIEKRIIELKQEIAKKPKELRKRLEDVGVSQSQLDGLVENENEPLQDELKKLEIKRQFILDRRNSWVAKSVWNVVVPIVISVITAYLVSVFVMR